MWAASISSVIVENDYELSAQSILEPCPAPSRDARRVGSQALRLATRATSVGSWCHDGSRRVGERRAREGSRRALAAFALEAVVMSMASEIATHDAPAWQERANFIIFADLSSAGMPGRWEQLWARQLGEAEFELCCIPYFTYSLALGDRVRTQPSGGRRYVVAEVHARSGRRVLRLWLKEAQARGKECVLRYLESSSPLHEWSSDNLLAIDVPAGGPDPVLSALLAELPNLGVDVEWAD